MTIDSPLARQFVEHGRVDDCPVIDTHAHYGPYKAIHFPKWRPADLIDTMDRCGVTRMMISGHRAFSDTVAGNREIADVIAAHPRRLLGYWVINPSYPEQMEKELAEYHTFEGFVGFKFHPGMHSYSLDGDAYKPALEYADERRLAVLSHTWAGNTCGPEQVQSVAEAYPNVRFLMGHSCHAQFEEAGKLARDFEHVYCELCAAYAQRGSIETMIEQAGSQKILFGTDHPWFDHHYGIGCVLFGNMTEQDRRNILYRNAERIFADHLGPGHARL